MFLNKKAVKQLVKEQGKRISKQGVEALDAKVRMFIMSAVRLTGSFKTITDTEIYQANGRSV
jgi:hypothetical protein